MSGADVQALVIGTLQGLVSSSVFLLALFIGVCVLVGLAKLKQTAGNSPVTKSLDESVEHRPTLYLSPTTPRGSMDQLRAPELLEAVARK